jgi:hypothetical protein
MHNPPELLSYDISCKVSRALRLLSEPSGIPPSSGPAVRALPASLVFSSTNTWFGASTEPSSGRARAGCLRAPISLKIRQSA